MWLPEIAGVVTAGQLAETVDYLEAVQLPNGMMPWFDGGHADPWNHTEALMALAVGGRRSQSERGFEWLKSIQREDGSWHQYYLATVSNKTSSTRTVSRM